METIKYSCDKCKKEVPTQKDLRCIEVKLKSYKYDSSFKQKLEIELCSECAENIGLVKRVVKDNTIVDELQDTKDELYKVVVRLIQEIGIQVEY